MSLYAHLVFLHFFADIIAVADTALALKNPFNSLHKLYSDLAQLRSTSFIGQVNATDNIMDPQYRDFQVSITLLPHQILVLPFDIYSTINPPQSLRVYSDTEIRSVYLQQ